MQLAARSYLAAGVALVGASAIAVSPMAPAVPEVHVPVALTAAVDNPLTVFAPVATATQTLFENIIERQTTNPAPIPRQLADNAVAGYQAFMSTPPAWQIAQVLAHAVIYAQDFGPNVTALGETSSAAMTALIDGLSELGAGLPAALQAAGEQFAAGDPSAAINAIVQPGLQPIINILVFAVSPELTAVGKLLDIPQPLVDAGFNAILGAGLGLAMATVGIGYDLPGPTPLVKQLLVGAQSVVNAATSGDPVAVVNALQHSTADMITATIGQVDSTIQLANSIEDTFVDALNQIKPKPFTPPDIDLPTAKALAAPTPAAIEVSTLQAEKPESTPVTSADNASGTEVDSAAAPAADASDASADANANADAKPVTKLSTKVSPKAAKSQAKANSAKTVRDQVKSTVKKLTEGIKKEKPAQKKAESSSDSAKGADSK